MSVMQCRSVRLVTKGILQWVPCSVKALGTLLPMQLELRQPPLLLLRLLTALQQKGGRVSLL